MGSEQQHAVEDQLERIIGHCLKLEHSANPQPRRQWTISVNNSRGEIARRMTATIRREVEAIVPDLYRRGRRNAELALADCGDKDAARALPADCP